VPPAGGMGRAQGKPSVLHRRNSFPTSVPITGLIVLPKREISSVACR
jgi:hypothetical protein